MLPLNNSKRRTRHQTQQLILDALERAPFALTAQQIAHEINRKSKSAVRDHLADLVANGAVIVWQETGTNGQTALFYTVSDEYREYRAKREAERNF